MIGSPFVGIEMMWVEYIKRYECGAGFCGLQEPLVVVESKVPPEPVYCYLLCDLNLLSSKEKKKIMKQ